MAKQANQVQFSAHLNADAVRLRLELLSALSPMDRLRWNELGVSVPGQSAFAQPWFVERSIIHCDRVREARLAIVEDLSGDWLGVMPLRPAWRYGRVPFPHWQAWQHPNMFTGTPLVRGGSETLFWRGLIGGLEADSASRPALRLQDLPSNDTSTRALVGLCYAEGRPIKFDRVRSRAMLESLTTPSAVKPDLRRRLTSLERRLAAEVGEPKFSAYRDRASIEQLVNEFLRLERSGWKGRAGSALGCDENNEAFFRSVVDAGLNANAMEMATLQAGGRLLAISAHFVAEGGWSHGFKSAFEEDFAAFAPGVLLLRWLTGHFAESSYLPFDSCSAPEQQPIGKLWPARREFIDCGVALGGKAGSTAFRALTLCENLAHRCRPVATANA